MSLTVDILAQILAVQTATADLSTPTDDVQNREKLSLTNGTGAGQADVFFHDKRTLAASATDDLDVAGSLLDKFGATLTCVKVKAIYVKNLSAFSADIQVGGAAANALINWVGDATDKVNVRPGGFLLLACSELTSYAVTAGTGDLLRITNGDGSNSVDYEIIIIGTSA